MMIHWFRFVGDESGEPEEPLTYCTPVAAVSAFPGGLLRRAQHWKWIPRAYDLGNLVLDHDEVGLHVEQGPGKSVDHAAEPAVGKLEAKGKLLGSE